MDSGFSADPLSDLSISPGNSRYYIPRCNVDIKLYVGQLFETLDHGFVFYLLYASHCGFNVRKSTKTTSSDGSGVVIWRYVTCSREGYKLLYEEEDQRQENPVKRRRTTDSCGCPSFIAFKYQGNDGYKVTHFEECHTHVMVPIDQRHFLKNNRKLLPVHRDFIVNCMKSNIGTSKAFKLYKNTVGSYAEVGASLIDFKNFGRDLNVYMHGYDGQMVIDSLTRKRERCPGFCFDYHVNDEQQLCRLFWCDSICRKNLSIFGDVVSADATYKTNRYGMVFVPFTGVDNHKHSITFGLGLLLNEDIGSYVWLFEKFKNVVGSEPHIILTDQDLAVKAAIEKVFSTTVHHFCMWHIMFKVVQKVHTNPLRTEDFRKRFNKIVWSNEISIEEIEEGWNSIIIDFNLQDNTWLQQIYGLRSFWIPAFFQTVKMGGLLRTTSRSESQNNFFSNFISPSSSLVVFLLQFDNAIDSQRHIQSKSDFDSSTGSPSLKTPMLLEKHCADVFTLNVFYEIQEDIYEAAFHCGLSDFCKDEAAQINYIHITSDYSGDQVFVVKHSKDSDEIICSCNKFLNVGHPCAHILYLLKTHHKEELPGRFILPRWKKKATLKPIFPIDDDVLKEGVALDEKKALLSQLVSFFHSLVNDIEDDPEAIKRTLELLKNHRNLEIQQSSTPSTSDKSDHLRCLERFVGPIPETVEVLPPPQTITKGRPRQTRLKSTIEKVIVKAKKEVRSCKKCNKPGHNIRTCTEGKGEQI